MPLLTLFSAPKGFDDAHIATIQRNAIRSWTLLPDVDVLLLGEEAGMGDAARELGVKHLPHVKRNEKGTPLISSMFELARANSEAPLLCIINADMILLPDFVAAAKQARDLAEKFVLLSQRWDLDVTARLDFNPGWEGVLREHTLQHGELHRPAGSDFFLFPRACYQEVPDFAIGRAGWDNWMIYKARREKWRVIDCTPSITIIHQNHRYGHLPGGQAHYNLPETNENIRLAGGEAAIRYTITDSTDRLANGKLVRPGMSYLRFMRGVELALRRIFFFLPEGMRENVVRPKRWRKRIARLLGKR
ncbi:MAG: hypothetical protein ACM3QS_17505 [Bacteroidota bacterium]